MCVKALFIKEIKETFASYYIHMPFLERYIHIENVCGKILWRFYYICFFY